MYKKGIIVGIISVIVLWYLTDNNVSFPKDGTIGKRVLITGASSGIGEQLAYEYARHGASVFITARREERMKQVISKCRELGHPDAVFGYYVADMRDYKTQSKLFVEAGLKHLGGIDSLILNHFLVSGPHFTAPWMGSDAELAGFEDMLDANMKSYIYIVSQALPGLRQNGHGRIGVVGSINGKVPIPLSAVYCTVKFALDGFFSSLRLELSQAESGVSVTYGVIGGTKTAMLPHWTSTWSRINSTDFSEENLKATVDWLAEPGDVAYAMMVAMERGQEELYYPPVVFYVPVKLLVIVRSLYPRLSVMPIPKQFYDTYL